MIHYFYEGIIFLYIDNFRYLLITYSILLNIELGLLDTELLEKERKKHTWFTLYNDYTKCSIQRVLSFIIIKY